MAWESSIDRLVLKQIHLAESSEVSDREIESLLQDLLQIAGARPQTWFHAGYARTLLGLDLPAPSASLGTAGRRWFEFGRLKGHLRREDASFVATICEDQALLIELMSEARIAAQILPGLVRTWFGLGDYETVIRVLEMLSVQREPEMRLLVDAALIDLLARVERSRIDAEKQGSLRRALVRARQLERFQDLEPIDRARLFRVLGSSYVSTGEWDEARRTLEEAASLVDKGHVVHRSVSELLALVELRVCDAKAVEPRADRGDVAAARAFLDQAAAPPSPAPGALYVRGILGYESSQFATAWTELELAVRLLRDEPQRDEGLYARARFYLGASLLAGQVREEARRAAALIAETLDTVEPDLASFYRVYDELKAVDPKTALRFLDCTSIDRGASVENLLLVALEYQSLGEPAPALRAAERVLELATDLDQRLDALKVKLCAHNMQGHREDARSDWLEIRDLLQRRGRFEDLERTLHDEALVGQALDHLEIKCELADLYEEMEGKDWERAQLRVQIARALKARKEVTDLHHALALLQEVGLQYPELACEDLQNIGKLLALREGEGGKADEASTPISAWAAALGHAPRILVVGGNEQQRKHHPRLEALGHEWGFESEWLMANYTSPQKLVGQIADRLAHGIDALMLLHWNRHETTEPALERARQCGVPARTVFYAGFTSLQVSIEELATKLGQSRSRAVAKR